MSMTADGVRWPLLSLAKLFVLVIVVGSVFALPKIAAAATRTWDGGGTTSNWSEPANWSSNLVPTAADVAVFNGTSTKNATIDTSVSLLGLSMSAGYTGTVTQAGINTITTTGGGDLVVTSGTFNAGVGTISVADQFVVNGGTFNAATGLLIVDGGDFVVTAGTFNPGAGTVRFNRLAITININVNQNFHNVEVTEGNNLALTVSSGDTIIVNGTLTLADGVVNTGAIKARGNVIQGEFFDGGTSQLDFDNAPLAQVYTVNGGTSPSLRLDEPADANDEIRFAASGTLSTLAISAGFGQSPIPVTNPNNVGVNIKTWNQAAGTYDASAQASWGFQTFIRTAGTFTAPATVTAFGVAANWDVPVVQEFRNFTVNKNAASALNMASGDTFVVTGTTTFADGLMRGATLQAAGNVKVNPEYEGGTTILTFVGNANQILDATGAAALYDGDINVNKAGGGEVQLASPLVLNAANQDLTLQVGTLNLKGQNLTVNGASARVALQGPSNFKLQGNESLVFNATYPAISAGATVTYTGDGDGQADGFVITTLKNVYQNLVIDSLDAEDTFVLGSALDVNASLTIAKGTLDATLNNFSINVAGNWSNNGVFTANQGTVTLDGTNQSLIGSTNFFNLTKAATGASSLTLDANAVQTVSGTMNVRGPSASARMVVRSSVSDVRARLVPLGPRTVQFLDLKDIDNDSALALPCVNGCLNSGNNENWSFASFTVTPISGSTNENAGKATYTIVLDSQPTTNVVMTLTSTNTAEGTVSPTSITFSRTNWNVPRTVTVSGIDDVINDGDIVYAIHHVISGGDPAFTTLGPFDVAVTNLDNEQVGPGVLLSAVSANTTELGGKATFTVVLASRPQANVVIGLTSSDTTEGTVSPSSLTFTNANWATPRIVTVTGRNDNLDDGDITYNIVTAAATSTDPLYSGLNGPDAVVITTDDDTAGYTLTPISGPTTEIGGTATFTLRLNAQPTATVVTTLASSDVTEGTVSPTSISFSTSNWATPRTITVRGVNDALDDGDIAYNITFPTITSTDTAYSGFSPGTIPVINVDDDSASIVVTPASGNTTEAAGKATFTVVLGTQPAANVTIGVSSANANEGVAAPSLLTFTTTNWNVRQTVTVTGVNDALDDGDVAYTVAVAPAVSTDASFNGLDGNDVALVNLDDDAAGITVSALTGNTTEVGGTATFSVVLNTQPSSDVVIGVASTDATEGAVSPAALVFNGANWNVAQIVTVTGVNDVIDDGDITYGIDLSAAVSTDLSFNGFVLADFSLINIDDDVASIVVSAPSAITTTEAGSTATFTVVLGTQPASDVAIAVASSDTTEATAAPASLVFTSANWNAAQTVTVTGVNDSLDDGDIAYKIVLSPGLSSDLSFNGLDPNDLSFTNTDDDVASLTVSTISGNTTEEGGTATFSVVLGTQPAADVTLALSSSDSTEGVVSSPVITFTPVNWNVPQVVTVTGLDDAIDDGDIAYSIVLAATSSLDPGYNAINPADITLSNIDNDEASLTISAISGNTSEAGSTATFTVFLGTEPGADVEVLSTTSDTSEGVISSGSPLLFTPLNWSVPQTVTITGVDDALDDGDVAYTVDVVINAANTDDSGFAALGRTAGNTLNLTNIDNDAATVIVTPAVGDTTEEGGTATFTVVLGSEPSDSVNIALSTNDATEGAPTVPSLTFTPANWNVPQTVTVTGVDDTLDDGDVTYVVVLAPATSRDTAYNGVNPNDVDVRNIDNDNAVVNVSTISGNTTEAGGTATFTVVLGTQPTADVSMGVLSNDPTEGTAAPASLVFTATNWNVPQTVTVTGVNDAIDDGDVNYSVVVAAVVSTDTAYSGQNPADVAVLNVDDDISDIVVSAASGTTSEEGGTATFTVSLPAAPTANVTIPLTSSDITEGVASVASLVFTPVNWATPQTVTVTGVDDAIVDGTVSYLIALGPAQSTDVNFAGADPNDVALANTDDDTVGVTLVETDDSTDVTEGSAQDTYTLVLNSAPTAPVAITIFDDDQVNVDISSFQFTALDWNIPRVINVTAENDTVPEGAHTGTINHYASSTDPDYNNAVIPDVIVHVINNDDVVVTPTPGGGGGSPGGGGGTSAPVMTLRQPNGGQTFAAGQTTRITWSAPALSVSFVNIYLSIDGGATFTSIALNEANDDSFTWTVPNIATTRGRIRIQGSDNVNVVGSDTSDTVFRIVTDGSVNPGSGTTDPGDNEPTDPTTPDDGGFIDPAQPTEPPITEDSPGYTPVFAGDFVRGRTFSTVFYMADNGQGGLTARPFIDRQTFFTYSESFDIIKTIADPQFTLYSIGSPMLPKPGVSLVKIVSSERVYLPILRDDGRIELRQIDSESLAVTMFGDNWSDYVIDLPPTIWGKFVLGRPLIDPVPFDASQLKTRAELNR